MPGLMAQWVCMGVLFVVMYGEAAISDGAAVIAWLVFRSLVLYGTS
jgi:hypothetical protein